MEMIPSRGFNPRLHPRRAAMIREHQLADRARGMAQSLTAKAAGKRLGMNEPEMEQLAARHGFAFLDVARNR